MTTEDEAQEKWIRSLNPRLLRLRLQMIADAASNGASLTWIKAVADEALRGEELVSISGEKL